MEIKLVKRVSFSPTGTTESVLRYIAQGLGVADVQSIPLTRPGHAQQSIAALSDDLVIIGAPVYGGRLPVDAVKRFKQIKGEKTPAVLVVVYGNRAFEDALLELNHLAIGLGFVPVAGAAFIGEHSFASTDVPIANGRPDAADAQKALAFGSKIKQKIASLESPDDQAVLELPGAFPYEAGGARAMAVSPVSNDDTCTACGTCAEVCPTGAISMDGHVVTDIARCIRCCACIKNCPAGARTMEDQQWMEIADWLKENCRVRKEPQFFGVDI